MATEYEHVQVTRTVPIITAAPARALMSAAMLRTIDSVYWYTPDVVYLGDDPGHRPVYYRVVGWDTDHKALIIERTDRP